MQLLKMKSHKEQSNNAYVFEISLYLEKTLKIWIKLGY